MGHYWPEDTDMAGIIGELAVIVIMGGGVTGHARVTRSGFYLDQS